MKKILLLSVMVLMSMTLIAQDNIYVFRVFAKQVWDRETQEYISTEKDLAYLCVIDFANNKVEVRDKNSTMAFLSLPSIRHEDGVDKDGDAYLELWYEGIDEEKLKTTVVIRHYKDPLILTLVSFLYSDIMITFHMRILT